MTWEETILFIRTQPEYNELVEKAYFDENLPLNVERFRKSDEYRETLRLLRIYAPNAKSILDIGCGNGISSIAFALDGYTITACEPDPSNTVGAGAVQWLKEYYGIDHLDVYQEYAEKINFPEDSYDVVYVRQAMHHAHDLQKFLFECTRVLKPNGIMLTIRDHVVYNTEDKELFFQNHPLHKFYGGENAYTTNEYKNAMSKAKLKLLVELKYYDSIINYFPSTREDLESLQKKKEKELHDSFKKRIGLLSGIPFLFDIYKKKNKQYLALNEAEIPGRMYSYILKKI